MIIGRRNAGVTFDRQISRDAERGAYAVTGQNADLIWSAGFKLDADHGIYSLTGKDADLQPSAFTLNADPGIFALTGQDATLTWSGSSMLQSMQGAVPIPHSMFTILPNANALGYNPQLFTAGWYEALGYLIQIPKTGNVHKIWFRTGVVTTGDVVKVGLYVPDFATGLPTATAYGGMVAGTHTIANTDTAVWFSTTLGTDAAATKGDFVFVVIAFNSFVAGNFRINSWNRLSTSAGGKYNYTTLKDFGGAWSTKFGQLIPMMGMIYDDGTAGYIPNSFPFVVDFGSGIDAGAYHSVTTASNPNEYGMKFQLPFPTRVCGAVAWVDDVVGTADTTITLYDSDGTSILASVSSDKNLLVNDIFQPAWYLFPTPAVLNKNTDYRIAIKPTAGTLQIFAFEAPEAACLGQTEGGTKFILTTRQGAGAWTDTNTKITSLSLLCDQFNDGI